MSCNGVHTGAMADSLSTAAAPPVPRRKVRKGYKTKAQKERTAAFHKRRADDMAAMVKAEVGKQMDALKQADGKARHPRNPDGSLALPADAVPEPCPRKRAAADEGEGGLAKKVATAPVAADEDEARLQQIEALRRTQEETNDFMRVAKASQAKVNRELCEVLKAPSGDLILGAAAGPCLVKATSHLIDAFVEANRWALLHVPLTFPRFVVKGTEYYYPLMQGDRLPTVGQFMRFFGRRDDMLQHTLCADGVPLCWSDTVPKGTHVLRVEPLDEPIVERRCTDEGQPRFQLDLCSDSCSVATCPRYGVPARMSCHTGNGLF